MISGKTVGVVIPAFNEEKLLSRVLKNMPSYVDQVVVVNDGSTDNTLAVAQKFNVHVISHPQNKGLASTLKTGWRYCMKQQLDAICEIAGDAQHDPREIKRVVLPIINNTADLTKGTRFVQQDPRTHGMPKWRFLIIHAISYLTSILSGYHITDASCGFTCMEKNALKKIDLDKMVQGYGFNVDLLLQARVNDFRVQEVSITTIYGIGEQSGIKPLSYFIVMLGVFSRAFIPVLKKRLQ